MEIKKYTGFTLIELLAVIVILAVIALIATPIIMNVINDSKEGAAKDAMYGYVKAIELASAKQISPTTDAPDGDYTTENGNLKQGGEILEITFKGTKPANNGAVTLSKGSVVKATLEFDGITVEYDGKKAEVGETAKNVTYQAGDVIYYNPETNTKCNSSDVNSATDAKTGCLKWNAIKKDDNASLDTIAIMLDHNTTANVAWNLSGNTSEGMKEAATALASDITSWNAEIKTTARFISGQEVADIVGDTSWTAGANMSFSITAAPWLYQNLGTGNTGWETGALPYGYWTSTTVPNVNGYAWAISNDADFDITMISNQFVMGVRPVITIEKSVIA